MGRFSARDRVRKRADFRRIQETGRRVVSPGFIFLLQRSAADGTPRLGITASRRVGNSAERNRAKRLVREAFRATRAFWPAGAEILVIVRQAVAGRKLADVLVEWQAAQERIARRWTQLTAELGTPMAPGSPANPPQIPLEAKKSC
jgi:ribonuclease P protein component